MLIRLDLPTLLLPIKAYSGIVVCGHCITSGLEITKEADCIIVLNSKFLIQNFCFAHQCSILHSFEHKQIFHKLTLIVVLIDVNCLKISFIFPIGEANKQCQCGNTCNEVCHPTQAEFGEMESLWRNEDITDTDHGHKQRRNQCDEISIWVPFVGLRVLVEEYRSC